jgi:hypothetical protein
MQVTPTTQAAQTSTQSTVSGGKSASDVAGQKTAPTDAQVPAGSDAAAVDSSAYTVSLSPAALASTGPSQSSAWMAQLDSADTALRQARHAKEPKKMKTLLELMLEWGKKYEAEADARAKKKQLQPSQSGSATAQGKTGSGGTQV